LGFIGPQREQGVCKLLIIGYHILQFQMAALLLPEFNESVYWDTG